MAEKVPLWPGIAPGSPTAPDAPVNKVPADRYEPGDYPSLTPYLAYGSEARPMVIVLPGGGYGMQSFHEGEPVARMFNEAGMHAAVLHYRCGPRHRHPAMLHDVQRAVRLARSKADQWLIAESAKGVPFVGVCGFSAGGHLAATVATLYDRFTCKHDDLAPALSARPDAVGLFYPVIDLGQFRHHGSLNNLLGPDPEDWMVEMLSCHRAVKPECPPAFLWHTADDSAVPMENSLLYFQACRKLGIRAELHVYESGPHGLGLAEKLPTIATWAGLCAAFFRRHLS